jgi:outer membrane biosynthesis protein TonB
MSRLQKKCFIGATSLHGLLLLALVVGPGFFTEKEMPSEPMIEIITDRATDAINPNPGTPGSSQGAPPPPVTPPPQVQQRQPTPEPEPPRPTPPPVERVVQREEVQPPKPNRQTQKPNDSDKPKKSTIKISDTKVKLTAQRVQANNRNTATADAQAKADAKAAADRARLFAKAGERIGSGISSSTTIKLDGPVGNGGAGLANYGQIVRKRYTDAWVMPTDLTDDEATIEVTVTIRRDGTVLSARIIDSTGSRLAANSIQRTLDRVTSIGVPFPDGATESQRTFTMTFSLKAKKSLG